MTRWTLAALLLARAASAQVLTNTTTITTVTTTTITPTSTNTITTITTNTTTITPIATNTTTTITTNIPPKAATPSTWKGTVSLGVTIARGNSDTTLASITATAEKKWQANDLVLEADGLYGESKLPNESKNTETEEILHGFSQYNRFFGDGFYGFGRLDGFHDGIADIKYRLTVAPGLGYFFVSNKITDLSAEAGPGYIYERLDDTTESYATLRVAQQFHYTISPNAKAWETIEFLPQMDNLDNYIVNFETGIEAALTKDKKLSWRTVVRDSFDNKPAPGRLKNDLQIIAGLSYKF